MPVIIYMQLYFFASINSDVGSNTCPIFNIQLIFTPFRNTAIKRRFGLNIPLYKDALLFNEICILMSKNGFSFIAIESGFSDPVSGQLLQVDGIFHRP